MHLIVHVPLSLTPAAVDNDYVDENKCDHNANDCANTDAVTVDNGSLLNFLFHVQRLETLIGRMSKAGTDGIEDAQGFNLTTIRFLVYHDGWVYVGAVFLPVVDLRIDIFVLSFGVAPGRLFLSTETVLNTLLSYGPV